MSTWTGPTINLFTIMRRGHRAQNKGTTSSNTPFGDIAESLRELSSNDTRELTYCECDHGDDMSTYAENFCLGVCIVCGKDPHPNTQVTM